MLVLPLLIKLPVVFSGVVVGVVSQVNGAVIAHVTVTPAKVLKTKPNCGNSVDGTVIVQLAVNPPSAVVTVMVAVPAPTPVTTPAATVATAVLLEAQVSALFVALSGRTVAVKVSVNPV